MNFILTLPAIFVFESWNSSEVKAEIITLETFVLFALDVIKQGIPSHDLNIISHTSVIHIAIIGF